MDYRIKLGDISAAITNYKDILVVVVVSYNNQLITYYICNNNNNNNNNVNKVNIDSSLNIILKLQLTKLLLVYIILAFFVKVNTFLLYINSKIDQKALLDLIVL